ncbi:MAG: FRG domain-containing protein [Bryobacteraceae bacterium]
MELKSWSDFEGKLREIEDKRSTESGQTLHEPLFRGLGDSTWTLATTLERAYQLEYREPKPTFLKHYRKVLASKPAIETLSGKRWDQLPEPDEFNPGPDSTRLDKNLEKHPGVSEYLVYLRHHGFPSPLLDWTASPYVAAFFAFDSQPAKAERVSIYAFLQDPAHGGISAAHLFVVPPLYMHTDPRHYSQQSRYTMCTWFNNDDWRFRPHECAVKPHLALGAEGMAYKITLPVGERLTALKDLDRMNINSFTLFGSEDSLIRSVARRELLFQEWK